MVLKLLKKGTKQHTPAMCAPACIKTILDNQFPALKPIRLSLVNKYCKYNNHWGVEGGPLVKNLNPNLKSKNIQFKEDYASTIDNLVKLLESNKYPLIYWPSTKYSELKDKNGIRVRVEAVAGNDMGVHAMIVVGIEEDSEGLKKIYLFDPWKSNISNEDDFLNKNKYDIVDSYFFHSGWEKEYCQVIWAEESKAKERSSKQADAFQKKLEID